MNTLRFFPEGRRNCYKLPLVSHTKFLFRAVFFYGDYDGLSRPPSFSLEIDGNSWATGTTSMNQHQPVYHELIYRPKEEEPTVIVSVCLVRTREDAIPFISSLEVNHVYTDMYKLMENKTALYLHSRINYGANRSVEKLFGPLEECCNRVWKSKEMSEYLNITENPIPWGSQLQENDVPWPVMATFIQAKNVSDSSTSDSLLCPVFYGPNSSVSFKSN
ncbi:hypothetical protein Pint_32297 [Pistacia integerrima]|uniref:Uncharacterized protein n=1 Tax=Pistacia integerrima TaxID=434235 RepID=A0ACC0XNR6_9ROSI|nr:hypothetical protein Pint_32297 [Pistacia integerrima]